MQIVPLWPCHVVLVAEGIMGSVLLLLISAELKPLRLIYSSFAHASILPKCINNKLNSINK